MTLPMMRMPIWSPLLTGSVTLPVASVVGVPLVMRRIDQAPVAAIETK